MVAKHLLITGGTGFFGKSLLRHWFALEQRGTPPSRVTVLSRDPKRFFERFPELSEAEWLGFVTGDILDKTSLPKMSGVTHVLHAAAESTIGPTLTPLQHFDQIVNGTRNILELARSVGAHRILFCSSGGVYGPPPLGKTHIDENYLGMPNPLDSANAYGIGKRAAEHLCAIYGRQFGLECVIARCFAFVGRDLPLDAHFAIGNFIRDAISRPSIIVNGDGSPIRSYMDQRDLARWLVEILERGSPGRAYNVGSDHAIAIRDLATLVRDLISPEKSVEILASHQPEAGARNIYVPSVNLAREELKLGIKYALSEAVIEAATHAKHLVSGHVISKVNSDH